MDNSKLLNWGLAASAVAILAALVGYLFFWSPDETTACRNGMTGSGDSTCMKDGGCDMMDGMGGMSGMMGGPTGATSTPLTIDQAADAAQRYLGDYGNPDLKVREVVEFTNNFYVRVVEQSTNSGAFELLVNRSSGEVTSEPGPNMMWNNKYGAYSFGDGNDGMMEDGSMGGMHDGMMDGSGGSMDGGSSMMQTGSDMLDGGTCGMMGNTGGQANANASTNGGATTDMPVKKAEARDRAQKYLDTQFLGARAGEPDTYYGYYTVKMEKDGRIFGILSVNGYYDQFWYHAWLGVFLSAKQF